MIIKYILLLLMVHVIGPNELAEYPVTNPKFDNQIIKLNDQLEISVTELDESLVWTIKSTAGIIDTFVTTVQHSYARYRYSYPGDHEQRIADYNCGIQIFKNEIKKLKYNLGTSTKYIIRNMISNQCGFMIYKIQKLGTAVSKLSLFRLSL